MTPPPGDVREDGFNFRLRGEILEALLKVRKLKPPESIDLIEEMILSERRQAAREVVERMNDLADVVRQYTAALETGIEIGVIPTQEWNCYREGKQALLAFDKLKREIS